MIFQDIIFFYINYLLFKNKNIEAEKIIARK